MLDARREPSQISIDRPSSDRRFVRRLFLVLLALTAIFVAWRLYEVIVLAFGAVLLSIAVYSLAHTLSRVTRIPEALAVAPVVLALTGAICAVGWLFGSQLRTQFDLLAVDLPQSLSKLIQDVGSTSWGAWLVEQVKDADLTDATRQIAAHVAALFSSTVRAFAYLAVFLFAAICLAIQPNRYRNGLLRLVPPVRRDRFGDVIDLTGATLRRWIVGQSITMILVGTLTALGLWLLGVGAPLALGLIAGIFAFIPYVGPILASVPGILMAATQGPMTALYAAMVYGAVHFVEGNLLTPLVQAEAIELPPVLTIFATLVFGLLLGPIGVLLAAPLTVVFLVAINTLYVEDTLGEQRAWPPSTPERPTPKKFSRVMLVVDVPADETRGQSLIGSGSEKRKYALRTAEFRGDRHDCFKPICSCRRPGFKAGRALARAAGLRRMSCCGDAGFGLAQFAGTEFRYHCGYARHDSDGLEGFPQYLPQLHAEYHSDERSDERDRRLHLKYEKVKGRD